LLLHAARNYIHFRLRLPDCHAGLEPCHRHQPVIDSRRITRIRGINRLPQIDAASVERREAARHHSDNRRNDSLNVEALSQYVGIAVELVLPEGIADHHRLCPILGFFRKEYPAENWLGSQQAEKVRRHVLHAKRPRFAQPGNGGGIGEARQCHVFEHMILLVPVDVFGDRGSLARIWVRLFHLPNHYQLFRLRIRQGPKQHRVQHAIDRTVGRNSQRK
jgi:hypothetical protein